MTEDSNRGLGALFDTADDEADDVRYWGLPKAYQKQNGYTVRTTSKEDELFKTFKQQNKSRIISIIGMGPVGTAFAAAALGRGLTIYGYDYSLERVNLLLSVSEGKFGLEEDKYAGVVLQSNHERLHLNTEYDDALAGSEIKVICVGTDQVYNTIKDLAPYIKQDDIVIIASTLFIPMVDKIVETFKECGIDPAFDVCLAIVPERIMEGLFVQNFRKYPKTIGPISPETFYPVADLYKSLGCSVAGPYPAKWVVALKAFENASRYAYIAIANMFADIAKQEGLDFRALKDAMVNMRPDMPIMKTGIGIGGPCIPMAAERIASDYPSQAYSLKSLIDREYARKTNTAIEIHNILVENGIDKNKVAVFGATYRAGGTDKRESPAMFIIKKLKKLGYNLAVYDPYWKIDNLDEIPVLNNNIDDLLDEYDAFIVLVGHQEYIDELFPKSKIFINLVGSNVMAHPDSKHYRLYK